MENHNNSSKFAKNSNNTLQQYIKESRKKSIIPNLKKRNLNVIQEKIKEIKSEDEENNYGKKLMKNIRRSVSEIGAIKKLILNNSSLNKEIIMKILEKNPKNRKEQEIKLVCDYLCDNYNYFKNIKISDSQLKVEKLAKVAKIKIFYPGETIIRFGDIGDRFYIVMEGMVQVYKPIFVEKKLSPNEFIKYIKDIKNIERDERKYLRIKEHNKKNFDISEYEKIDQDMKFMNVKRDLFVENLQSMGIYGEGFSFGEISLMTNAKRNATIKCSAENNNKYAILLSIGKDSYDRAIKEYQEKKLTKDIENFIKTFPFFREFTRDNMISIFNCITKINLEKDDYLFHQNDEDTNIYFIINGQFEVYTQICLSWINKFMEYIVNMRDNILGHLYVQRPKTDTELLNIIRIIKKKKLKSPMIFEETDLWEKIDKKVNENNLIGLKLDEEKINDNKNIHKIKIQNIDRPELLGIENSFEFKNKFYTVRCLSDNAEIKYIKIMDFVKIISSLRLKELNNLLDFVLEKKNIFAKQIINSMKTIQYKIISNLEMKYEQLLNSNREHLKEKQKNNNEEYNNNKLLSVIKAKGYKSGICDLLDEKTNILDKNPSEIIKSFLIKKKEPSKNAIKLSKKQELIDFIFTNKTKNIKREKDIYKNNKENLLILKKLMKNNNSYKNMKKFNISKSNISNFILNNSINNLSFNKIISNNNTNRNDFSITNSINDNKFTNSFLVNSNYIFKKLKQNQSYLNNENKKNTNPSNYLTYINTRLNNKKNDFNLFKSMNNIDDKSKTNMIRSALLFRRTNNIFNKTNYYFVNRRQKIKDNDSLSNKEKAKINNSTLLNISDIKSNNLQKGKKKEKEILQKKENFNNNVDNEIFGTINKNKKEFYLGQEFSNKIENINKQKDERLLNHYFPKIKK